jgi:RNA polymerase sigma factor (sigma-70 family)
MQDSDADDDGQQRRGDPETNIAAALAAHRRGETDAINRLSAACYGRMEKLARRQLIGHREIRRGLGDTEDVTQQAWIRLWTALQAMKPESELHLMRLAALQVRRELIDLTRKYGGPRSPFRNQVTNVVIRDGREIDLAAEAAAYVESPTMLDEWGRFHDAIERLPEDLRDVFAMRFYLGASVEDVARSIGCDPRTVKRRWAQAKDLLTAAIGRLPA